MNLTPPQRDHITNMTAWAQEADDPTRRVW